MYRTSIACGEGGYLWRTQRCMTCLTRSILAIDICLSWFRRYSRGFDTVPRGNGLCGVVLLVHDSDNYMSRAPRKGGAKVKTNTRVSPMTAEVKPSDAPHVNNRRNTHLVDNLPGCPFI